jgi:hypothetical protein
MRGGLASSPVQAAREPERRRSALAAAGALLPALFALCSGALAQPLPEETILGAAASAVLLSLPRWFLGLWIPWGLIRAWRERQAWPLALALLGLIAVGIPPVLPEEDEGLLIVATNVQAYSDVLDPLEEALAELDADLIVTMEMREPAVPGKVEGMVRTGDNYEADLPRVSHGTAVFCRRGRLCQTRVTGEIGAAGCTMPMSITRFEGRMCVVGIHAPPPAPKCALGLQPYVDEVVRHLDRGRVQGAWGPCEDQDPALVIGDLNFVPGSRVHRKLLNTGLRDALVWQGLWANSWPAGGGWPNFPFFRLDQFLVGEPLTVRSPRLFKLPDADHRAIRARVEVKGARELPEAEL